MSSDPGVLTSLVAGATAGIVVDLTLFPIDTIKTRLQSKSGLFDTGGFSGIYKGILPVLLGSAPVSALFFVTYNGVKNNFAPFKTAPIANDIIAACVAEVVASILRVPIEIIKQRRQVSPDGTSTFYVIKTLLQEDGFIGLYRGFPSTICREIPFSCIQYPLWEWLKQDSQVYWQVTLSGGVAGAVAATLTTPMDVVKTRVMLAEQPLEEKKGFWRLHAYVAKEIYSERGIFGFFYGIVPRVLFMTLGGFIYFGAYSLAVLLIDGSNDSNSTATTEKSF